ncbi:type IX secretion system periplasmic lipoprotein PorW/SprE [Belliella kenyensis]|nr:gliding motility protein [Belliella kenyensis]MCH7402547.1 gliding motility protein [Belliella kenyensis]MDN3603345.1 gliding motility protein [Belliella kenyensis]
MKTHYYGLFLFFLLFFSACSSEKNTFTNRMYHNTTSRYNAYYLSNLKIQELEQAIEKKHKEDFSQVLPIFYPIDSALIDENKELLKEAREFSSKAIDWHRISKWVDDNYFLIGMVEYYKADFDDAINTFKYLNVNSKDRNLRHRSLIQLLRIFVDLKQYDDVVYVIDYLSKEQKISAENRFLLFQTLGHYYHAQEDTESKIGALDRAVGYAKDKKVKSRLNFILAQLYQQEGLDALAYDYYQESLKGNPPYERSFYAQLYSQQVAELNKSKDIKKVRAYYDDLYKNSKNKDLRDVILYEKALFELKQEEKEEAVSLLKKATKEEGSNPIQKGYIYRKLAEISLEDEKDYRTAKYYLDSALMNFRPKDVAYDQISKQKGVLDEYVIHFETIITNDSLINLSKLTPEQQERIAENFIKAEEDRLIQLAASKEKEKNSNKIFDNLLAFSGKSSGSGESFYFDNPGAMQQGTIDFARNWGNRPLTDNWRRSSQSFATSSMNQLEENTPIDDEVKEESVFSEIPSKASLLSAIPKTEDDIKKLNDELEVAYFELGKLLFFDFKEPEFSVENLERLITTYPNTNKKPEAYYILHLALKEKGGNAELYSQRLNREFPESPFTYSVNNPNKLSGNQAYLASSENYKKAYELYQMREYSNARSILRNTLEEYPLTRNTDKILLLDVMISGKIDERDRYQSRLENYIQSTENPELSKMARNMLIALTGEKPVDNVAESQDEDANLGSENATKEETSDASTTSYKENPNQTHIFVIVLEAEKSKEAKGLLADLENFHKANFANARLRTGNMNLNRDNAIYIVSPFNNAEKAVDYRKKFLESFESSSLTEIEKANTFLISIENFQELNKQKNIEDYRTFYKKTYK